MSDARSFYTGWLVDEADRQVLLARIPPKYPEVVAHHVTQTYGDQEARPPTETVGEILGEADDGRGVQALVVSIGGTTERPDGSTYHITWSLAAGRQARESNDVIAAAGWTRFATPIRVRLAPRPSDG